MAQMAGASGLWRVGFGVRSHPMWPPRAGVPTKQGRTPPSQKVAIQMSACPPPLGSLGASQPLAGSYQPEHGLDSQGGKRTASQCPLQPEAE